MSFAASKATEIFNEMSDFIERIDGKMLYEHHSDFVGANHDEFCVALMDLVMNEKTKHLEAKLQVAVEAITVALIDLRNSDEQNESIRNAYSLLDEAYIKIKAKQ